MAEAGANAVLVVNPSYYKNSMTVSGREAIKLFSAVSVTTNLSYDVYFLF
jgi:dihydrodipicolinate synthase/N-acetylneuraminate lyase